LERGAVITNTVKHEFQIVPSQKTDRLEVVCGFSPTNLDAKTLPSFGRTAITAQTYWNSFWQNGGAIDLSGSKDPRWFELERRIVLSEYLTAIQERRPISAGGDGPDLQFMGGEVSSRNVFLA
jgi:hypothetical protein